MRTLNSKNTRQWLSKKWKLFGWFSSPISILGPSLRWPKTPVEGTKEKKGKYQQSKNVDVGARVVLANEAGARNEGGMWLDEPHKTSK